MSKKPTTIAVRLPPYHHPRKEWRRAIHAVVAREAAARGIEFGPDEKLEIWMKFYFDERKIRFVDVDNRVKDVLDAPQGLAGSSKKDRLDPIIIPNDNQVFRVIAEKGIAPKQSKGLGHLKIRRFSAASRPVLRW